MVNVDDTKWHKVNSAAAEALTTITHSPGVIYGLSTADLPENLQRMPGVSSYYLTGYISPEALSQGLTVAGEVLVTRIDGDIGKNYQFVIAVSSEGATYFNRQPYKSFSGHHVTSGQSIPVNSLFGHTPFSKK